MDSLKRVVACCVIAIGPLLDPRLWARNAATGAYTRRVIVTSEV